VFCEDIKLFLLTSEIKHGAKNEKECRADEGVSVFKIFYRHVQFIDKMTLFNKCFGNFGPDVV